MCDRECSFGCDGQCEDQEFFAVLDQEDELEANKATLLTYGDASFCYDCGAIGEKIGHATPGDTLHCTECHAEWQAVSLLR
jgi:hypothetical protein